MPDTAGDTPDDPPRGPDSPAPRLRIRKRLTVRPAAESPSRPVAEERITLTRRPAIPDPDPSPPPPPVRRPEPVDLSAVPVDWRPTVRKPRSWLLKPPALAAYGLVLLLAIAIPGYLYHREQDTLARQREAALALARGHEALAQQRPKQAIADYSRAIELDPALPDTYPSRGTSYWLIGALAPAEADFRKSVALRPAEPLPLARLIGVLGEAGRKDEAERTGRQAFEQDRSRDWALSLWLGAVQSARGADSVLAEIATLEKGGVRNATTALYKGTAYLELKRYAEAIPPLKEALQGDPAKVPPDAAASLAAAYKGNGDRTLCAEALAEFNRRSGRSDDESKVCE